MDEFATNIVSICEGITPYVWALVIAAFLIIGVCMVIPSEKSHSVAKSAIPWVFVGAIVAIGCVYLGKWVFGRISF